MLAGRIIDEETAKLRAGDGTDGGSAGARGHRDKWARAAPRSNVSGILFE